MSAYDIVLIIHNWLRWIVLLTGLLAAGRAIYGWVTNGRWTTADSQLGLYFTMSMDIQVLLGLILYVFLSPLVQTALSDFGAAMSNDELRFYAVEHILLMIIALGLAHAGRSLSKKAEGAGAKHKRAAIFFTLAMIAILAIIPWGRPLLRLG